MPQPVLASALKIVEETVTRFFGGLFSTFFAMLLLLLLVASSASAQTCSFSMPNVAFGTVDVTANIPYFATSTLTANCTGTANSVVRICPGIAYTALNGLTQQRNMGGTTPSLQFNLYQNSAYTTVWGSYNWGSNPMQLPPTLDLQLNSAGVGSLTQIVYGRIPSGQTNVSAGNSSASYTGNSTDYNYAYSTNGTCQQMYNLGLNLTRVPFIVTATVPSGCSVVATNVNFGTQTLLASNVDQTNTIGVRCTSGVAYTVGLNGGTSNATDPAQRKMSNGGGSTVTYGVYRDSNRSLPWGSTSGTNTLAGTGNGSLQNYTAYLRIPPQSTPPAGTYVDSVVVTVTY